MADSGIAGADAGWRNGGAVTLSLTPPSAVMPALVAGIHASTAVLQKEVVDTRPKGRA